ncbi:MAG: autoinducer binding domain-containing protein [bacterium]
MNLKNILSKRDLIDILELIHKSLSSSKDMHLIELINELNCMIPFDYAIYGLAQLDNNNVINPYQIINVSYPPKWFELYIKKKYYLIDPIVQKNFSSFKLQYWAVTYNKMKSLPKDFLSLAYDFGIERGYSNGVRDNRGGSLFSIAGRCVRHDPRSDIILRYITPHLHQAMISVFRYNKTQSEIKLSPREKEILKWVKDGKTSWDISVILNISGRTVNFHIDNIKQKLDVINRTQAVAIALKLGLIDID